MPEMRRNVGLIVGGLACAVTVVCAGQPVHAEDSSRVNAGATVAAPVRARVKVSYLRVVLDEQRVYVFNERRRLVATLPVSTGLVDTTPVGRFKVFSKSANTFYAPNPRERMRWMVRFTKGREGGNIGFHSIPYVVTANGEEKFPTPLGHTPSSHGCVRVGDDDAKWLFDNVSLGTPVIVQRSR